MSTIEDEARARLEEQLSRVEHYGRQLGNAPVKRATFNVDDVRTLLAASRREPSEPEYVGNERDVLGEDENGFIFAPREGSPDYWERFDRNKPGHMTKEK